MSQPFGSSVVSMWLDEIGFSKYEELFRANEIDADVLGELTNDDLKELEIPLGDRKKLLRAIARLPGASQAPATAPPGATQRAEVSDTDVERRQISVLFCDLTGSTEMAARLDPEDVADAMRVFQKTCAEMIESGGGFVARYQGDAVLAYFGWPRAYEDDAERCVRTGLDLVEAVGKLCASDGSPLLARVGIATGLVMVGELIGEGLAQEKTVVGATPNLAARLESLAEPGTVTISATTAQLIGDLFELRDLGQHPLKGFPKPEQVWNVERARAITSRFGVRLRKGLTPLVGRRSETDQLVALWEEAKQGRGQVAAVVGEAGIGKSRLVQSLDDAQTSGKHKEARFQCNAFQSNSALNPVIEYFSRVAEVQTSDKAEIRLSKLEAFLERAGLASPESVPLMATLLSIPWEDSYPPLNLSPQLQGEKLVDLVIRIMLSPTADEPLELVFEDIHWADPTTLRVIDRIMNHVADLPVLVVITYRPEFRGEWPELPNLTLFDLRRLSRRQVRAMVKRIAGGKILPEEVLESITTTTDGIPLFVEELTKTILESGQLSEEGERFVVQGDGLSLSIPATLRDSLAARLDQLNVGRELAQVGATIGRVFSSRLAGYILKLPEIELREPLMHLCEAGIIERHGSLRDDQYLFKHALFQEVAYRSQLKSRRRQIHLQIANALEDYFQEVAEGQPESLARHFEEAGSTTRAADYLLRAGTKALHVNATREAIAHLTHGKDLVSTLPRSESRDLAMLRFHASLGTAYMLANGWAAPEVEQAYEAANKVSYAATDAKEAIWILWGIWVHRHVRGQIDESIPISDRITAAAARDDDPGLELVANMVLLQVSFYKGRFGPAVCYCQSVENEFRPEHDRALTDLYSTDLQLVAMVHHSIASWIQGHFAESAQIAQSAESLARELQHPYSLSWALLWGATPALLSGDLEALATRLEEGVTIAREQGFAYAVAMGTLFAGWVDGHRNDLEGGIARMQEGLDAFRDTGAEIAVPYFRSLLADLHCRAGNTAEALQLLEAAERQIDSWGECWQEAEVYRIRGKVLAAAREPDLGAAEQNFRHAIALAEAQGAAGWQLRAALPLATLLRDRGDNESARRTLQAALGELDPAPEVPDYAAVRNLLDEIDQP